MFDKSKLVKTLDEIAKLMQFLGVNPFKVNAFSGGANIVRRMGDDFEEIIQEGRLPEIKGVGKGLQAVIMDFYENGESETLNELKEQVPKGIMEMFSLRGLGPKKIKTLYKELEIETVEELKEACLDDRVASVKGFGKGTQEKILIEIENFEQNKKFILLSHADKASGELKEFFKECSSILQVSETGKLRRVSEVISRLDFAVLAKSKKELYDDLISRFDIVDDKKGVFNLKSKYLIPLYIHYTEDEKAYPKLLFRTTGSNKFINQFVSETIPQKSSEHEIFEALKIPYVIPEMREQEFVEASKKLRKYDKPLEQNSFKGFLHFHTKWSDGNNTLAEMVDAADETGYEYFALCDHSKTAVYANGLTEERIPVVKKEVKNIASDKGLPVLFGVEADILKEGDIDYDDDVIKEFEFIVASVHSSFTLSEKEMTARMIKAAENEYTDVIGHPTGRLLLTREAYKINMKKLIDACAANDTAIELNCNPHRLDIDWRMIWYARKKGCRFSINQDAHSIRDIPYIKYGIAIARKAGLTSDEIINCYDYKEFRDFVNRKVRKIK